MVTIENQLKKLQQCLNSTTGNGSSENSRNNSMGVASGVLLPGMTGISSSTVNSASENEVICIREAETSDVQDTSNPGGHSEASNVITDKTMLIQKSDQDLGTDDNNSTTDDNT